MATKKPINWLNTLFLTITPVVSIVGTIVLIALGMFSWKTVILMLVLLSLAGLSITGGYHRCFSHKCYETVAPVRLLYLLFGASNFEGSVLEWSTDHRNHHRFTDTKKDPYNIQQGFWYAHIGWLLRLDVSERNFENVEDLKQDKLLLWQHRYFVPIAIVMGFILPMLIASLWGDAIGGLIIAGVLRVTIAQQMTFCINSVCHYIGKQSFSDRISARDNWFTALFTFGEGYHNFHHKFPLDYRNGIRFYDFDPTKWLIKSLEFFGLAKNLKSIKKERILQCRLEMQHQTLMQKLQAYKSADSNLYQKAQKIYQNILDSMSNISELERAYQQLKASKLDYMKGRVTEYKSIAKGYSHQISNMRSDLQSALKDWNVLLAKLA